MSWDVDVKSTPKPVSFSLDSNKARAMRDIVDQHGGSMPSARLKQMGHNLSDLKLSHLVDPHGNISSEKLQAHINSLPKHTYHAVEGEHGFELGNMAPAKANKEVLNTFIQRHTPQRSKVTMFEVTPTQELEMKQRGLWDTFKKFQEGAKASGHPMTEKGFGWVRHTEGDDGIHIDEVQSDFPKSLQDLTDHQIKNLKAIKNWDAKTTKYAKKYHPQGHLIDQVKAIPDDRIEGAGAQFAQAFGDEKLKAIHELLFKGQKPNQMLHEAFLQKLRDDGKIGKPIHIWTPEGKGKIALSSQTEGIPGHMHETYGKIPSKIGYKPATYGEIATQSNPELRGMSTQKMNLTKAQEEKWAELVARSSALKKAIPLNAPVDQPLGQTTSGKPIHLRYDHPAHAGYTPADHKEAHDLLQGKLEETAQAWKTSGDKNMSRQMNMMRIHQNHHADRLHQFKANEQHAAQETEMRQPKAFVMIAQHALSHRGATENPVRHITNVSDLATLEHYHGSRQHEFTHEPLKRFGHGTYSVEPKTGNLKFMHADYDTSDQGKVR
jgi:hypothetical protein